MKVTLRPQVEKLRVSKKLNLESRKQDGNDNDNADKLCRND